MLDSFTDYERFIVGLSLSIFMGLLYGSFATALIYRIPRSIPWITGTSKGSNFARSACTSCGQQLSFYELFPVFSWLLLRGRCKNCKTPIGYSYIITEISVVISCLIIYSQWGLSLTTILLMTTTPFLMSLIIIDWKYKILPNQLVLILFILGIFFHIINNYENNDDVFPKEFLTEFILGSLVYGGIIWGLGKVTTTILKKESLGFGDVKFFIVAGLWLGLSYLPYFMMVSGLLGIVIGLFWKKYKKEPTFPFGPALIISLCLGVYIQHSGLIDVLKHLLIV